MHLTQNLIFIRHGESIGNTMSQDDRSRLDIANHAYPLTDVGRAQALAVGQYLKKEQQKGTLNLNRCYPFVQSTFLRSQQTMDIILKELRLNDPQFVTNHPMGPKTDARLDEKWDGIFHELSKDEIRQRYPEQIRCRERAGYYHYRAPGGESCPDAEIRIRSFVRDYFRPLMLYHNPTDYVVIVGHGRWFQIFQKICHNLSVEEFIELKKTAENEPCAVTIYPSNLKLSDRERKIIPKSIIPWKGEVEAGTTTLA